MPSNQRVDHLPDGEPTLPLNFACCFPQVELGKKLNRLQVIGSQSSSPKGRQNSSWLEDKGCDATRYILSKTAHRGAELIHSPPGSALGSRPIKRGIGFVDVCVAQHYSNMSENRIAEEPSSVTTNPKQPSSVTLPTLINAVNPSSSSTPLPSLPPIVVLLEALEGPVRSASVSQSRP